MPLKITTHHRGNFVNITLSVIRFFNEDREMTTQSININDMAEIIIKMKKSSESHYHNGQTISFKKTANANNLTVSVDITSDDFKKRLLCQDEWVEVPMNKKDKDFLFESSSNIVSYLTELNIIVHASLPAGYICTELYEETKSTDFEFVGEDGSVPVHKGILLIHSEMFRGMLRGEWKETKADSMKMPGVTVQTLQHLKQFMYLGTVPDEGLEPLLSLAKYCLMDKLASACIDKLVSTVKAETIDGLVKLACQKDIPELIRALLLGTPDDVINGIFKMDRNAKKANEETN